MGPSMTTESGKTALGAVAATIQAMRAAGIGDDSKGMVVRRVDGASAVASYKGRLYLLTDSTGNLDYAHLNRKSVRATELVGF
jgi:hypothetical protein